MLNKCLAVIGIFVMSFSTALAAGAYLAPYIEYENIYVSSSNNINHNRYEGLTPGIALGYGINVYNGPLYLAGEGFVNPIKTTDLTSSSNDVLRPGYSYGASLIPGVVLDGVIMPYLRLGAIWTHFNSSNTTKNAYQLGAGIDIQMKCVWTIRAEFDFTRYSSIDSLGTLKETQGRLMLVYHFDPFLQVQGL